MIFLRVESNRFDPFLLKKSYFPQTEPYYFLFIILSINLVKAYCYDAKDKEY